MWPHGVTWVSARSEGSLEEEAALGEADTRGREVLEATATHPRVVEAGVSLRVVEAGDNPTEVVGGANPTEVVAGDSLTVAEAGDSLMVAEAGDSPMVAEAGVKVVASTTSGTSPVSRKPT